MKLWLINLKIAVKSLRATKMRTALTVLGIVIGVASVTAVMALGEGAKNMVRDQVAQLGDDIVTVRPGKATRDHGGNVLNYDILAALSASTLTERDLQTITQTEGVAAATPFMAVTGSISDGQGRTAAGAILATTPDCSEVFNLTMRAGEFISEYTNRNSVVLGRDLAVDLLGSDVALGQKIQLRGKEFTVIGIAGHFASSVSVSNVFDLNRAAFIHMSTGKSLSQGVVQIQQINARVQNSDTIHPVTNALHQKLLSNHDNQEDFTILRPQDTLRLTDNLFRLLTNFISAVASVSILVGGVGIMNIMLVSVTERTREIGIRKAVGATNLQILWQFLIEGLAMTLTGGIIGIGVGYGLAFAAGTFLGFMPSLTWGIIGIALAVSTGVGLLFGAWPAIKAARKDPIEALRYFQ